MANPSKDNSLHADAAGNPLLSDAQTLIADQGAITVASMYSTSTLNTNLGSLRTKINAILDVLEAHGLMKDT